MEGEIEKLHRKDYKYYEDINLALVNCVPCGCEILDVGCSYGTLGETIKQKRNYVVGLEKEECAVEKAKSRLDEIYCTDIVDFENLPEKIRNRKFDVIIFADILEHLYDPYSVLIKYQLLLKPGGKIIISIPNMVVWDVRLKFMFGIFDYSDTGTCDRTHVRFFTRKSFRRLLHASDLKIVKEDFTPGLIRPFVPMVKKIITKKRNVEISHNPRDILDSSFYKIYIKWIYPFEKFICVFFKSLLAFQFIFVVEKK